MRLHPFAGREFRIVQSIDHRPAALELWPFFSREGPLAAKQLVCGMLQIILLCCIAECSTPGKRPAMLSHEAFARSELLINQTARPLERSLFGFYFAHGSRD